MADDNPVLQAIFARTSMRSFTDAPVPRETVELLLRAAMSAPTAKNVQPWCFMALTDRLTLDDLADVLPYGTLLGNTPQAILVAADLFVAEAGTPGHEFWVQDCAAAAQNILLAAEGLGLGAVWLGVYPIPDRIENVSAILKLPEHIKPLCLIAFGYPSHSKTPKDKFQPDKIHWGRW